MGNFREELKIHSQNVANTFIIILRHGLSTKNLLDLHGNVGGDLTNIGEIQMQWFANVVNDFAKQLGNKSNCNCYGQSSHTQIKQSIDIIIKNLNKDYFKKIIENDCGEEMRAINLGVASGKSNEELRRKYPQAYEAMENARKGVSNIWDMYKNIGFMENPKEFEKRMNDMLMKAQPGINIYVCKTSQWIMLTNLLMGWNLDNKYYYEGINPNNADTLCFQKTNDGYLLIDQLFPSTSERIGDLKTAAIKTGAPLTALTYSGGNGSGRIV